MENTYRILPWKKARSKSFSRVKPPKSRSVSALDEITESDTTSYGSTTSLPTMTFDDNTDAFDSTIKIQGIKQSSSSSNLHHREIDPLPSPLNTSGDKSSSEDRIDRIKDGTQSKENTLERLLNESNLARAEVRLHEEMRKEESWSPSKDNESPNRTDEGITLPVVKENQINGHQTFPAVTPKVHANGHQALPTVEKKHDYDGTLTNKNNIIILNNVGVENANEYDRLNARDDNELAILLQELDSLISSLPESRQIGTPFWCSNFVAAQLDHRGGRIRLSEPDVCLCVPPGALPQGQPQTLYMYIVNPKTPALSELGNEDHWLTPIVHCGPPGIQFQSYVGLSLPSSVADEASWDFTVSRGVQPEYKEWESLENRDDSVVFVKSGRITVLVDHFSPYGAKGKPNSGETVSKWMEAGVFVHPPCGETGEQEVQFHVRIWNVADRQRVLQEERKLLRTCLAEPLRAIRVYDSGCPVEVLVDEVRPLWVLWNHTGRTFPFQNLWREHRGPDGPDSPSITFVAQASQSHLSDWYRGSFRATIKLFQQGHQSEGISFIVKANPDKMGTFAFKDGQLMDGYGTTLLRQQSSLDQPDSSTPTALFPLSEERFHEVCLQLDGTPTETGEKSWRAFARTADLNRKELDAITRCAQQHQHKSPSDLLLTYFVGDPCRSFDTLRTLQEIWYVLYHIGNDGAKEEVEEEMYERMTAMRGKPRERMSSDISSGIDHPSELSSLVMTSDEQMSDLDEEVAKDSPLQSTAIEDDKLANTTGQINKEESVGFENGDLSAIDSTNEKNLLPNPLEELVESSRELILNTESTVQELTTSSQPQESFTDVSDDLELQLTEFSKHWAVSEDSLGSDSDLSPASEAELLKILLADDDPTRLSGDKVLGLDDPQRQATELPLNSETITSEKPERLTSDSPSQLGYTTEKTSDIVIYMDDGTVVELRKRDVDKYINAGGEEPDEGLETSVKLTKTDRRESPLPVNEVSTPDASFEVNDISQDSSNTSHHDVSVESSSDVALDKDLHDVEEQDTSQELTQDSVRNLKIGNEIAVQSNVLMESDQEQSRSGKENLNGHFGKDSTTISLIMPSPNDHLSDTSSRDLNVLDKKPNGHIRNRETTPVNNIESTGFAPMQSPGKSVTKIAYQTTDIDHHTPTASNPDANHNKDILSPADLPSTRPLTNGTANANVTSKSESVSLPNMDQTQRGQPRSPKSPKREDRDRLRQLARLALTGKENEDEIPALSSTSPVFDFSQLQPVKDKEEFV